MKKNYSFSEPIYYILNQDKFIRLSFFRAFILAMKTIILKAALLCCAFLISSRIEAQTYVGISMNIGNRLSFSPESDGFSRPVSVSGSLLLRIQEEISEKWALQYGFDLGVLGYTLKIVHIDTLESFGPSIFTEYSTFYGSFCLLGSRTFNIKTKELMVGFGGGASYYFSFLQTTNYFTSIIDDGTYEDLFSGSIESPSTSILPFAKISAQLKLNFYLTVGLEYTHHFGSVLDGTYELYHSPPPTSGNISLYPRELSFVLLVQISNRK